MINVFEIFWRQKAYLPTPTDDSPWISMIGYLGFLSALICGLRSLRLLLRCW